MEEKGQLLRSQQRQIEELKKQQKFRKQQKDRYALEVKNTKEAVLSLERDRTAKYEKQKVETLKEQAITETEPKLLAIIKGAKDDARRAE